MRGTPCQSWSVAGQRAGLDDPRASWPSIFFAWLNASAQVDSFRERPWFVVR
ncbi:MAG: DNA cytosine methyltransferase [Bryobacteraceae bacterium]